MDRYQETIDRVSVVRRFLIPVQADDYVPGRPRCWGLSKEDFELVVGGYACSSCLACWQPAVLDECPVCGERQIREQAVVERPDWEAYDRHREKELANPTRTKLRPMHEMVEEVTAEALEGHMPGVKRNL